MPEDGFQVYFKISSCSVPLLLVFGERLQDRTVELWGDPLHKLRGGGHAALPDQLHDRQLVATVEEALSRQGLPQADPQGEHVGAAIHGSGEREHRLAVARRAAPFDLDWGL